MYFMILVLGRLFYICSPSSDPCTRVSSPLLYVHPPCTPKIPVDLFLILPVVLREMFEGATLEWHHTETALKVSWYITLWSAAKKMGGAMSEDKREHFMWYVKNNTGPGLLQTHEQGFGSGQRGRGLSEHVSRPCLSWIVLVARWEEKHKVERVDQRSHNPSFLVRSVSGTLRLTRSVSSSPSSASKWFSHFKVATFCWITSAICWLRAAKIWSSLPACSGRGAGICWLIQKGVIDGTNHGWRGQLRQHGGCGESNGKGVQQYELEKTKERGLQRACMAVGGGSNNGQGGETTWVFVQGDADLEDKGENDVL